MRTLRFSVAGFSCSILAVFLLSADATAQPAQPRRGGVFGDYLVKMDFNGRQFESILSFSRDADGNRTGQWITFMGVNDLQDVQYEDGKLSFTSVRQGREGQTMTSKFAGTLAEGKLSGTVTGERGETKLEGERMPRTPRAAGSWAAKVKMGEREYTSTIVIAAAEENQLAVEWKSERVQTTVSDVTYERGRLAFKRKSKMEEREWESTFEGTIEGDTLTGAIKSERGEAQLEATRVGAPLIGTWNLEVTSERGARKQRLRVEPDMSGWFGSTHVKKIELDGDKVSFKIVLEFGDQEFEIGFAGTVKDSSLTGELTSERGTQKVTGTKVARRSRMGTRV